MSVTFNVSNISTVCGVPRREGLQVLRVSLPERIRHEEQEDRPLRLVQGEPKIQRFWRQ